MRALTEQLATLESFEEHERSRHAARMAVLRQARRELEERVAPGCHPKLAARVVSLELGSAS
jgi:hypothetical protein